MSGTLPITDRTRLRRLRERGTFSRETIYAILDAMPLGHVAYVSNGRPIATPTLQWREGDHVYWHGSSASRAIRAAAGQEVCLTVSILDGFVLARSGFHHSVNYRSAMIFGRPALVSDPAQKLERLRAFIDGLYPGRWDTLRPVNASEAKATAILEMPIEEASAKARTGGPVDDEDDYALPIWAGVIPVRMQVTTPDPDPRNLPGLDLPDHATALKLG
jgi:nitroimidazol reductase NimA-like FMN-containing flavoprotein (pyridoxamine 5'-phosphate oxidase superfamily)